MYFANLTICRNSIKMIACGKTVSSDFSDFCVISCIMLLDCKAKNFEWLLVYLTKHCLMKHIKVQYLKILLNSFGEENFQRLHSICYVKTVAIISLIMQVAPPLKQTLITHIQGLYMRNI